MLLFCIFIRKSSSEHQQSKDQQDLGELPSSSPKISCDEARDIVGDLPPRELLELRLRPPFRRGGQQGQAGSLALQPVHVRGCHFQFPLGQLQCPAAEGGVSHWMCVACYSASGPESLRLYLTCWPVFPGCASTISSTLIARALFSAVWLVDLDIILILLCHSVYVASFFPDNILIF